MGIARREWSLHFCLNQIDLCTHTMRRRRRYGGPTVGYSFPQADLADGRTRFYSRLEAVSLLGPGIAYRELLLCRIPLT